MTANKLLKFLLPATVIILLLSAIAKANADPDLWGYMAFGRLFWKTGQFPYRDVFSYLPTLPLWVYHEWLTGILFYPLYQKCGAAGLQLLRYALCLTTLGFIFLTARRRGADLFSATLFGLFIFALFLMGFSPVRAQAFTYAFFAISLYLLESARLTGNYRRLWLLIPLQALWCNLHGGFLSGLGLIALYAVGEGLSRRPLLPYAATLGAAGLATLLNPYGLTYWTYMYAAITMPRPEITEWSSMWAAFSQGLVPPAVFIYILGPVLIVFLLAVWARWREITPILVLGITLAQGVLHFRHLAFFLIVAAAYPASLLRQFLVTWQSRVVLTARLKTAGQMAGILLLAVFLLVGGKRLADSAPLTLSVPALPEGEGIPGSYFPLRGIDCIKAQGLRGKLLTEFAWGEYLIWELYPHCLVGLDGRYETVYPEELANRYFGFIGAQEGWQKFLADYPPDLILIDSRKELCALLRQEPHWRQIYTDAGCALFVRGKPVTSSQ